MSYDNITVPILGLIFFGQYPGELARLIPLTVTSFVFLAFTYFANGGSFSLEGKYRWSWFPLIGNLSLTVCDFVGNYLEIHSYRALTLPMAIALIIITVLAAIGSRSQTTNTAD